MSQARFLRILVLTVVASLLAAACASVTPAATLPPTNLPPKATSGPSNPTSTATSASPTAAASDSFTDPFAYCTAVGNADTPGTPYTGPAMPVNIVKALQKAAGAPADAPLDPYMKGSFWRCMDSKVYACFVGANLPCDSKANTDQTPTQAEVDYCKANPSADFIPAAVTGHDTIYEWACKNGQPSVSKQVFQVDARGYIKEIWYQIKP